MDVRTVEAVQAHGVGDATARTRNVLPALAAALFGAFLIFGAGFAQPNALHDAAHDARHAFAFPCH